MSIKGRITMEGERVAFNLAKLKKGGLKFEIAVDPDLAISFKEGKNVDVKDVLKSEKIFNDVSQGEHTSEHKLKELFGTDDVLQIAKKILQEGEIQLTLEYREQVRERKRKKIMDIIHRNGIDPRTKLPIPPQRIENAFEEAKIKINEFRTAEDQVDDVLKKLKPVMPISFATKKIMVIIPSAYASKAYHTLSMFAKPQNEKWNNDGSYQCVIEIPAGVEADFYDKINGFTHGDVQTDVIE